MRTMEAQLSCVTQKCANGTSDAVQKRSVPGIREMIVRDVIDVQLIGPLIKTITGVEKRDTCDRRLLCEDPVRQETV